MKIGMGLGEPRFDYEITEYVALRWSGGVWELWPGARVWSKDALFPRLQREYAEALRPLRKMVIRVGPPELAAA